MNHTWWLNQEYIPFTLFSNLISDVQKRNIADKLLEIPQIQTYSIECPNPVPLKPNYREGMQYELPDFVGNGSLFLFDVIGFSKEWLTEPVAQWESFDFFLEMKEFAKTVKITNDTAEHGVKFISDYAQTITKNESQRQYLLQLVQEHRKLNLGQSKTNFLTKNSIIYNF